MTSVTDAASNLTQYAYDTEDNLVSITDANNHVTTFAYYPRGWVKQTTFPSTLSESYVYDARRQPDFEDGSQESDDTVRLNNITEGYTYDPIYELTQVTQGVSTTESYGYDFVGNRLSSLGVPTYNYNPSNELTSNTPGSYTYDANGNTLSDPSGKSYTWDYENRLISTIVPGTGTVTFKYDPFGRRIQKSGPSGTTNYLYDGIDSLDEVDQNGNVLGKYSPGQWIDEPLAELRSGTTSYYDADALGSITSLTTSASSVANTYSYDSFGKLLSSTGTLTNPFQYTGREFDPETGLYYYRSREAFRRVLSRI